MTNDELYRQLVESSTDGIWVFDLSGRTIYANPALARMFGATPEEFANLTVLDSLDETGQEQFVAHLAQVRDGHCNAEDVEVMFVRRDGERMWVLVGESLLRGPDGEVTAVLHRITDYGPRRQLLDDLKTSREALAESQVIARFGSWTWDLESGEMTASDALFDLYEVEPVGPIRYEFVLGMVHPEDRTAVDDAVRRTIDTGEEFTFIARLRGGGDWLWIRGRGIGHCDETGRVVRITGTHQDITETRIAELALEDQIAQNQLLQAVASAANEARTLNEVLAQARLLVLLHDDWRRGRGFLPRADGGGLEPFYIDEEDRLQDLAAPDQVSQDLELAERSLEAKSVVWDEQKLTVAFPVLSGDQVHAVILIASDPPLFRHEMIENNVRQVAVQLGRVVERELAQQALADARDAAMEASRQKSEFLARMSHEIRTPLNGVIGLNDLLLRSRLDPEQARLAAGVRSASRSLLMLINEILDFSKIEAGKLELERVDFSVCEVVEQVTGMLDQQAKAKGIELSMSCDPSVPALLSGDPTRLGQVVTNLGSNAVKFTGSGEVRVIATAEPLDGRHLLRIEVRDTGMGIDGLDVDLLFDSFTQADASTTRVHGGTGLGLAIAREIVAAMGGQIGAAPREGGGSVFWFTVPMEPAEHPERADERVRELLKTDEGRAARTRPSGERHRILVVEDNAVNQMVAVGLLKALGYEAETADDGVAALEAHERGDYDLILMDVQMPRLDGYATTRAIRERDDDKGRVPVLAMTAAAIEGERERCLDAGMDDFLTKPVDPGQLAAALDQWLAPLGEQMPDSPTPAVVAPAAPAAPAATDDRSPAAGSGGALDLERLDMLRDMAEGDTAYLDRIIERFVANTPGLVDEVRAAVAAADAATLRERAHRLAGSALNIGARELGDRARRIEYLADEGSTQGAEELIAALAGAADAAREALLAYRADYRAAAGSDA